MINMYLTDEMTVITVTHDKWGVSTTTEVTGVACRVEDEHRLLKNREGQEVVSNCYIAADPDVDIKYESRIKITKRNGKAYELPNKQWAIMKIGKAHSDILEYWDIWV